MQVAKLKSINVVSAMLKMVVKLAHIPLVSFANHAKTAFISYPTPHAEDVKFNFLDVFLAPSTEQMLPANNVLLDIIFITITILRFLFVLNVQALA